MASSSVSQDDIDNDFEKNSRRSRIRTARARQINPSGCRMESGVSSSLVVDGGGGEVVVEGGPPIVEDSLEDAVGVEHDTSPKPMIRTSAKGDGKRPIKLHHVNKAKQQRDRRKLREKRRSTGVVHLASTESTGGSTTGDDETNSDAGAVSGAAGLSGASGTTSHPALGHSFSQETRRNTAQNENIATCYRQAQEKLNQGLPEDIETEQANHHQAVDSLRHLRGNLRRDKSPSDLEADDENDHDSLNQSETGSGSNISVCNLSMASGAGAVVNPNVTSEKHKQGPPSGAVAEANATPVQRPTTPTVVDHMGRVVEENKRLLSLMEEKDRRIHLLEYKVQQLMRDTLTISEEQSRLQKENTTLLRALSKLTKDKAKS